MEMKKVFPSPPLVWPLMAERLLNCCSRHNTAADDVAAAGYLQTKKTSNFGVLQLKVCRRG